MKVTVGGSFHEPGWTAVLETVKKLKEAGHEVLAPGEEWEPINNTDDYVRFKGEENASAFELQEGFLNCIDQSDAYVICNPNSYEGFMVSFEFGYASARIIQGKGPMKYICFTETPLGFDKFSLDEKMSIEEFKQRLYTEPSYSKELAYYRKIREKDDGYFGYGDESDYYEDLLSMYGKLKLLEARGALIIGIDNLIELDKSTSQSSREQAEEEIEF